MAMQKVPSGPIPGENFTSDTRNYPWHRPPEFSDMDKAIDMISKKLLSPESSLGIITMLKMKTDVATITDMFLTSGIGAGKWTPDFALLLAGPVSHIICLMAEGYEIDYDLGLEEKVKRPTAAFFKEVKNEAAAIQKIAKMIPLEEVKQQAAQQPQQPGGLMGMGGEGGAMPPAEPGAEEMMGAE
jgi:hypothetical protein